MNKLIKIKKYLSRLLSKPITFKKGFQFFYNLGIDFYEKKDYVNAINNFKLALEQKRIKSQVYYNLALSYQHMKDYNMAIVTYKKFLELSSNDYDGLYNLALIYYTNENYEKAVELFEKCTEIKQDEDGVKFLVLTYLNQNDNQKAFDFAERIFELPKNGVTLYYAIAKVFENKNSFNKDSTYLDMAIEMYSKIIGKYSTYFDAYLSLSICYAKKGEWENSVTFCKKALEINSKSYEANSQMGLVYYCYEELEESIGYYEVALKLNRDDYKIYSNLGYAYEKAGQTDKAIKIFTKLINKFSQYPTRDEIINHLEVLKRII